jgi:hypothetical protein
MPARSKNSAVASSFAAASAGVATAPLRTAASRARIWRQSSPSVASRPKGSTLVAQAVSVRLYRAHFSARSEGAGLAQGGGVGAMSCEVVTLSTPDF